jgi:hypothetical protein
VSGSVVTPPKIRRESPNLEDPPHAAVATESHIYDSEDDAVSTDDILADLGVVDDTSDEEQAPSQIVVRGMLEKGFDDDTNREDCLSNKDDGTSKDAAFRIPRADVANSPRYV